MGRHVAYLECSESGDRYEPGRLRGLSDVGKPLLVRYHLDAVEAALTRDDLAARPGDMWRYSELLPVPDTAQIVSLGETATPIIELTSKPNVLVKDESRLPTGSFKARGLAVAVTMARHLGVARVAIPTNGNAGAALAAYATRAGMESFVFCPADTPEVNVREIAIQGGLVWRVAGTIIDCARIVAAGVAPMGWFDMSTLKEPYRVEGKKTMGFELAEQLDWKLPDVIVYPTGGGTGLIAMWKAFQELRTLGWIEGGLPRMVAVQASGCAPIVRAWEAGAEHAEPWPRPETIAAGIRVPEAIGDFLILRAIRESAGAAIAVGDDEIFAARAHLGSAEGILTSPEGAATYAGYQAALQRGMIDREEQVVLFNCASGLKYPLPDTDRSLAAGGTVDWHQIEAAVAEPRASADSTQARTLT